MFPGTYVSGDHCGDYMIWQNGTGLDIGSNGNVTKDWGWEEVLEFVCLIEVVGCKTVK